MDMDTDMSLDEIIQKKKVGGGRINLATKFKPAQSDSLPFRKTLNRAIAKRDVKPVQDARLKIIAKKRAKIRDARDKIIENARMNGYDARQRLDKNKKINNKRSPRGNYVEMNGRRSRVQSAGRSSHYGPKASRPTIVVPQGYIDFDNMERMEEEEFEAASRLMRTVKNDFPRYETFKPTRSVALPSDLGKLGNAWGQSPEQYDPFDVYETPNERRRSPDYLPPPPKGILRSTTREDSPTNLFHRRYIPEGPSHLSYEMRTRLERAPDPHASMGIFSNPLKTAQISNSGYRIVVSNLHSNVSANDIKELFGDVGDLYESRIVRPGVAEVIYKTLSDAEKAVDTYHNRQLDGLPMKCLLVNPRASNKPTAPAIKTGRDSRYNSSKTPLEIDIDALHKVLFRRH